MTTSTKKVQSYLQEILKLEKKINTLQNDFLKNTKSKFNLTDFFTFEKTNSLYEITRLGNINSSSDFKNVVDRNIIYMHDFYSKTDEKYSNMLDAEAGFMYIYKFQECGKNGRAKKIGARVNYFTEYEVKKMLESGNMTQVFFKG